MQVQILPLKIMNRISKYLFYLTIFAIPFYIFRFNLVFPTTILEVLIYLSFLVALFEKKIDLSFKDKKDLFGLLFVLLSLTGVSADPNLSSALGIWKAYFFDGYLLYLLIKAHKEDENIINLLIYASATMSLVALMIYFFGFQTADGRLYDLDRLSPNYLAMFLIPSVLLSFYRIIYSKKYIILAPLAISALALTLTFSRGALIALAGGIIILIAYKFKKRARALFVLGSVAALLLASFIIFKPKGDDMGRAGSSSNIRYYIWATSLEMVKKNPLTGIGISNYQNYFTELTKERVNYPEFISPQALTAHNLYLHLLLTCGLPAFLILLALIYYSITKSKKPLIIVAFSGILFYGLIDTPFFRNDLSAIFWVLIALL